MRKLVYTVLASLLISNAVKSQNVSIATPSTAPDVSAKLDVIASDKGLLIPRVSLTSLTDAVTIATPATSLMVYNINATLGVGYYYNRGTALTPIWTKVITTDNFPGWSLTGNTGTSIATNFIGTTSNVPLRIKTNNSVIGHLSQDNIFLGDSAGVLTNEKLGYYNVGVGPFALYSNDSGYTNVAIGAGAMMSSTSDLESVAVGPYALASNDDYYGGGNMNTAVGSNALAYNQDGYYNTALGGYALSSNVSGAANTAIGFYADCYDTTNLADVDNSIAIGFNTLADNSDMVRIGDDNVLNIGGAVDWSILSDGRYKKDVQADKAGLDFVMQLRPVNYHYNYQMMNGERISQLTRTKNIATKFGNKLAVLKTTAILDKISSKQYQKRFALKEAATFNGLIAQEVEAAANKIGYKFSGIVKPNKPNGRYALRYATFVVPLIEAVQQQQQIIESQNKKIDELIKRIEALENK